MALKIIGSGLGRTGTKSLKVALSQLGFGPCHHMEEVFPRPESLPLWIAAGQGHPDWETIFDGFQSAVDYPAALFWRELASHYPEAKVIHSERDPDTWFDSTQGSIFAPGGPIDTRPPALAPFFDMIRREFGDHIHDRAFMTNYFRRHNADVRRTISADRLLIYRPGDGWEPLCAFLGVAIPTAPFPNLNSRAEFQERLREVGGDPTRLAR
jgi:hypothetical protein